MRKKYINFISAIITSIAILFNYNIVYKFNIEKIHNLLIVSPVIAALFFVFILKFYNKLNNDDYKNNWIQNILSILLSITMIIGNSFKKQRHPIYNRKTILFIFQNISFFCFYEKLYIFIKFKRR